MPPLRLSFLSGALAAATFGPPALAEESSPSETTLQSELDEYAAGFAAKAPAPMRAAFDEGVATVRDSGVTDSAKNVGDKAPAGELLDADGKKVAFESLWADGPVVVSFYRGGWCPYCNLQLKALQRSLSKIEGAGARLVAVTPELPEKATETTAKNQLTLSVLTDKDNTLARRFGIVFGLPEVIRPIYEERIGLAEYNGNDKSELPLAATYVIDQEGVVRWAFLDADYRKRAEPADIVAAVKSLE